MREIDLCNEILADKLESSASSIYNFNRVFSCFRDFITVHSSTRWYTERTLTALIILSLVKMKENRALEVCETTIENVSKQSSTESQSDPCTAQKARSYTLSKCRPST